MQRSEEEKRKADLVRNKNYREANAEKLKEKRRAYVAANRERITARDRERNQARYQANRDKILARSAKHYEDVVKPRRSQDPEFVLHVRARKYGLTASELRSAFERQGSCCAICRAKIPLEGAGGAHVDHDHDTDEVRGFLCSGCNQALGLMKDSPGRLRAAAAYLDRRQPKLRLVR